MAIERNKRRRFGSNRGRRLDMLKFDVRGRRHLIKTRNPASNKARFIHREIGMTSKVVVATIESVLEWLRIEGDIVQVLSFGRYVVQNKIIGEKNLLIIANRKRIEKNLDPFVVLHLQED